MKIGSKYCWKEILGINKNRVLQYITFFAALLLCLTACKQIDEESNLSTFNEQEISDLKEELLQTVEINKDLQLRIDELESEYRALLVSKEVLEVDLEYRIDQIDEYEDENLRTIQYYKNFVEYFKFKDYEVVDFEAPLYRHPDNSSEVIFNDRARGFIKTLVSSDDGEEWYAIELLYTTDSSIVAGYVKKTDTKFTYVDLSYVENKDILVKKHYIGEDISVINMVTSPLTTVNKGELHWNINDGEVIYGFNPINWKINSFNIIGEGEILDDKFGVGDNAKEAIDYYAQKFEMIYFDNHMGKPSDNIIKLNDGYLLIIEYDTGMLTSESTITEVKIFNEADMP